jgi:hypothetical protein
VEGAAPAVGVPAVGVPRQELIVPQQQLMTPIIASKSPPPRPTLVENITTVAKMGSVPL